MNVQRVSRDNEKTYLTKEARLYNGEKTISLRSVAGNTGQSLVKE